MGAIRPLESYFDEVLLFVALMYFSHNNAQ